LDQLDRTSQVAELQAVNRNQVSVAATPVELPGKWANVIAGDGLPPAAADCRQIQSVAIVEMCTQARMYSSIFRRSGRFRDVWVHVGESTILVNGEQSEWVLLPLL